MTPSELQSLASASYGGRWQSRLSKEMGIALRTVQRWARDGIEKTATSEGVRRFLEERRATRIAAPPSGVTVSDDRDDACRDALGPALAALVAAATGAGWSPAEALAAIMASTIDGMRDGAGTAATIETLRSAIASLKAGRNA